MVMAWIYMDLMRYQAGIINTILNDLCTTFLESLSGLALLLKIIVGRVYNFPLFDQAEETGRWIISGYEAKELGIKLLVTPRVNENQEIIVDLKPEISNYLGLEKISEERYLVGAERIKSGMGFDWINYAPACFEYTIEMERVM